MEEVRSSSVSICRVRPSAVPVGRKTSPNKGIHPAYQGSSSETPSQKIFSHYNVLLEFSQHLETSCTRQLPTAWRQNPLHVQSFLPQISSQPVSPTPHWNLLMMRNIMLNDESMKWLYLWRKSGWYQTQHIRTRPEVRGRTSQERSSKTHLMMRRIEIWTLLTDEDIRRWMKCFVSSNCFKVKGVFTMLEVFCQLSSRLCCCFYVCILFLSMYREL